MNTLTRHQRHQLLRLLAFLNMKNERYGILWLHHGESRIPLNLTRRVDASLQPTGLFDIWLASKRYATEVTASLVKELVITLIQQEAT